MGRPKKISDETILEYTKEYYFSKCHGNIRKMTYVNIAEYISSKCSIHVADYDLKKSSALKEYLAEIKRNKDQSLNSTIYFKRLDINNFLRMNNTDAKLRNALVNLDNSYEVLCHNASEIQEYNKRLKNRNTELLLENKKLKEKTCQMDSSNKISSNEIKKLKNDFDNLKSRTRALLEIINTYIYPEIANQLLADKGLIKISSQTIRDDINDTIMDDADSIIKYIEKREEVLHSKNKTISSVDLLMKELLESIEEK